MTRTQWSVVLAISGAIYSIAVTVVWLETFRYWAPLTRTAFFSLIFRPLWFGVALLPVTIVLAVRRTVLPTGFFLILGYYCVMAISQTVIEGPNPTMAFVFVSLLPPNLVLQAIVYALCFGRPDRRRQIWNISAKRLSSFGSPDTMRTIFFLSASSGVSSRAIS